VKVAILAGIIHHQTPQAEAMGKLLLLWLTLAVTVFYLVLPRTSVTHDYFVFSDQLLTLPMHVWFICEKLCVVIFAYVIWKESKDYGAALKVFFWLAVFRLIDYLLCYNDVWVEVWDGVPVTSNILSVLIFGLSIVYESIYGKRSD